MISLSGAFPEMETRWTSRSTNSDMVQRGRQFCYSFNLNTMNIVCIGTNLELRCSLCVYFLGELWLCWYLWAFSSCSAQGLVSCRAQASHCSGFSLWTMGSRCTGLVALWHVESWGPGIEPVSLALTGKFLTTGPLGKSLC